MLCVLARRYYVIENALNHWVFFTYNEMFVIFNTILQI